ncbi:MAG TPA: hypothetical protein VJ888_08935 [Mobilitalea sp.]|nr:hypothetical protein [Mobilitalea sp.]
MKSKDIVVIGMLGALLITLQVALAFMPNVELVSIVIILCTLIYGWKTLYIIYTFVITEGFIYGFGLWWINYLYVWTVLFLIAYVFRKQRAAFFWAILSGLFGLSFGALCSVAYLFMGGPATMLAYWVSGIPFDITHGISSFAIALILFHPLYNLLQYINHKY